MKNSLILVFVLLFSLTLAAQKPYIIEGKLTSIDRPMKVFLFYRPASGPIVDSVITKDGSFVFKGNVEEPVLAVLEVKEMTDDGIRSMEKILARDYQNFFLEEGKIKIKGEKMKSAHITAGQSHKEYIVLQKLLSSVEKEKRSLELPMQKAREEKNEEESKRLSDKYTAAWKEGEKLEESFLRSHPDSYVSLNIVSNKGIVIEPSTFEPLFNSLSSGMRNTKIGKKLEKRLASTKRTMIGQPAMAFTQNDLEGKPVSLSSFKGKYVFVDFWASWCGPCRSENPYVLKAYNRFKDKKLEIITISLDDKRENWVKAIEEDGMPWINVSDLKGRENSAAADYGISAIPQNFLLDPNGIIIARNLRGEALEKELEKLIK